MAITKTRPIRRAKIGEKKIYVIKRRQANPKSVRFENTQFTVRYKRIGKICVKIKPPTEDKKWILEFCRKLLKYE